MGGFKDIDSLTLAEIRDTLKQNADSTLPVLKVAFLRNITVDNLLPYLNYLGLAAGWKISSSMGEYDNFMPEVLTPDSFLYRDPHDFIIICLKLEQLSPALTTGFAGLESPQPEVERITEMFDQLFAGIRRHCSSPILFHTFETPVYPALGLLDQQRQNLQLNTIRALNGKLLETAARHDAVYAVDTDRLQALIGFNQYFDYRYWYFGKAPYQKEAGKALAREYCRFFKALRGKSKKCLVLDCDNTLWGGIVGEAGLNGIMLGHSYPGSAYRDFQLAVLALYDRGVMLALCSKNNENDVFEVLDQHPDMVLRRKHFAAVRINWQDKAKNLREIAAELNIGSDSLVFLDDSIHEVEQVRAMAPEVEAVQLPAEPELYGDLLRRADWFDNLFLSAEDRQRTEMYLADRQRKQVNAEQQFADPDDYLKYLQIKVEIEPVNDFSLPRLAQLMQKTNQFNLTTRRHTEADLTRMRTQGGYAILAIKVSDRFGDLGIVGAVVIGGLDGETAELDSLLMSCRVIGRGIEHAILTAALQVAQSRHCRRVIGRYLPTPKNGQTADFYPAHGFRPTAENADEKTFMLELDQAGPVLEFDPILTVTFHPEGC